MSDKLRELVKQMRETSEYWDTGWVVSGWCDELEALLPTEPVADPAFERGYAKGYVAALAAASAECRRLGEALDYGGNVYVRNADAIRCSVAVAALYVPSAEVEGFDPAWVAAALGWIASDESTGKISRREAKEQARIIRAMYALPAANPTPTEPVADDWFGNVLASTGTVESLDGVAVAWLETEPGVTLTALYADVPVNLLRSTMVHIGTKPPVKRKPENCMFPLYTTPTEPAPDREDAERFRWLMTQDCGIGDMGYGDYASYSYAKPDAINGRWDLRQVVDAARQERS